MISSIIPALSPTREQTAFSNLFGIADSWGVNGIFAFKIY